MNSDKISRHAFFIRAVRYFGLSSLTCIWLFSMLIYKGSEMWSYKKSGSTKMNYQIYIVWQRDGRLSECKREGRMKSIVWERFQIGYSAIRNIQMKIIVPWEPWTLKWSQQISSWENSLVEVLFSLYEMTFEHWWGLQQRFGNGDSHEGGVNEFQILIVPEHFRWYVQCATDLSGRAFILEQRWALIVRGSGNYRCDAQQNFEHWYSLEDRELISGQVAVLNKISMHKSEFEQSVQTRNLALLSPFSSSARRYPDAFSRLS